MHHIWLVLAFPLLGSLICATHYRSLGKSSTGTVASLAILGAFVVSLRNWYLVQDQGAYLDRLCDWLQIPGVAGLDFAALVDPLSTTMLCTVTGVAFLIHCYSKGYMAEEEEYGRFFACMNLFVATMVMLVLAANLGLLLVGWGGVGFASYSLIGFYRHKPSAVSAARKAFLINVVGDVGLMLAAFIVMSRLGVADFQSFLKPQALAQLGTDVVLVGSCLLVAAYAKSAQLPFHPWLPDAMEGPTPVSALIHAATMVTAGVYLVARCAPLFTANPEMSEILALCGATTALAAALSAVVQNDLKRILAYSTMSQLGYMFMACGVGAFGAAIFHLVTHAFFKALLFLTAGVVIHALHGEQDVRKMGGLGKTLPGAQLAFAIGSLALAGIFPLAGYFSKEEILASAFDSSLSFHILLWGVGIVTALLTAYYTGRAYFLVFWAPAQEEHHLHYPGSSMTWPLAVLALATVVGGSLAQLMGEVNVSVGGVVGPEHPFGSLQLTALAVGLGGLGVAAARHRGHQARVPLVAGDMEGFFRGCEGIDAAYLSGAVWFRRFADAFTLRVDGVAGQVAPELVRRSLISTSSLLCQLQGGNLRLYVLAVLAATSLLALFVYAMIIFSQGGGAA